MNKWLQWLFHRQTKSTQANAGGADPALMARVNAYRQQNAKLAVLDQYNDIYLLHLQSPRAWARYSLWSAALVLAVFIAWAAWFTLDVRLLEIGMDQAGQQFANGLLCG